MSVSLRRNRAMGAALLKGCAKTLRWTGYCMIAMLTLLGAVSMLRAF
jgi:hypothetical protein